MKNSRKKAEQKLKSVQQSNFDIDALIQRYNKAKDNRRVWENLWQECYDYVLPQSSGFTSALTPGEKRTNDIYDATAMDAADQLAASLLGNLTPIWSQWFGLKPGPELSGVEAQKLAPILEKVSRTIQDHLDRSNFAVEVHQCYLDLIVGGTASLSFEESEPGSFSAFRFSALSARCGPGRGRRRAGRQRQRREPCAAHS
ncbi:MAG: portal protein [Bacteroidota bacterium]